MVFLLRCPGQRAPIPLTPSKGLSCKELPLFTLESAGLLQLGQGMQGGEERLEMIQGQSEWSGWG